MEFSHNRDTGKRIVYLLLIIIVLISLSGVIYLAITPYQQMDPHTEFYILGSNDVANQYPTNLSVNEQGEFALGAVNNEHKEQTYSVVVESENIRFHEDEFTLQNGETWERPVTFEFESAGSYHVEILLYRGDTVGTGEEPYRELWMEVDVRE